MTSRAAFLLPVLVPSLLLACTDSDQGSAPLGDSGIVDDGGSDDGGDGGSTGDGGVDDGGQDAVFSGLSTSVSEEIGTLITLSWEQTVEGDTQVVYSVDPGEWLRTPVRELGPGQHEQLLLGVPFGTTVTARVEVAVDGDVLRSDEVTATAADIPDGLAIPQVRIAEPALQDVDTPWILGSVTTDGGGWGNPWWVFIVDRKGRLVWAWESPEQRVAMFAQPSRNGDSILIDLDSYWGAFDLGLESEVVELTLDGREHRRWSTLGLHHSFTELPDGSLAWGAHDGENETLQVMDPDGVQRQLWSCTDFVGQPKGPGECISNTVFYDEAQDRFLFSLVSHDTVVAIDGTTGELGDTLGRLSEDWMTIPAMEAFSKQHDVEITDEGTLLLSSDGDGGRLETVVREYRINPTTQILEQIWSYGDGEGLWAQRLGNAQRLPGGNTQHGIGSTGRLREITPDGQLALEFDWTINNDLGRTTAIGDLYQFLD